MSEDTIKVSVDTTEMDIAIAKAKQLASMGASLTGTTNVSAGLKQVKKQTSDLAFTLTPVTNEMELLQYRIAQLGLVDLPSANREMRVILGNIPEAREALQIYFRVKRAQMAVKDVIETGTLLTPNLILTLVATMTLVARAVWKHYMMIERDKREYEKMVRQFRGWTKEEFKANMKDWEDGAGARVR